MGIEKEPLPVKLFLAVMYTDDCIMKDALERCIKKFGNIDKKFGPLNVSDYTDYYDKEMGKGIKKSYMTFDTLINRDELVGIKTFTNKIEKSFIKNGKRPVNLDPGYLANDKLVLASTKDFFHRIYLDKGIYAEITLHFRRGVYRFFSWTFPDYREKELQRFLMQVRSELVKKIRSKT